MTKNDILTLAQRLREYNHNPHHINPVSDAFHGLIADSADALAQLAAIQGGMGEVVGFDRNAAYAACPESGCDWGSFYVGWKAAAAQHQRITAAMAAEVERWERSFRDVHEPALRDAHAYIQELRAELAATSEAQANTSEAAPGVAGLVKALEKIAFRAECFAEEERDMPPHSCEVVAGIAEDTLSTWRQAQEGKP